MSLRSDNPLTRAGILVLTASLAFATASAQKTTSTHSGSAPSSKTHSGKKTSKSSHHLTRTSRRSRGQQAIDGDRARQIQEALIREHYMNGQPSGRWDDTTQAALRRYQADQGWQNKSVPDSRALIRLGLGPDHEHLLNPESAMTVEAPLAEETRNKR